jgi:hypothetical protein
VRVTGQAFAAITAAAVGAVLGGAGGTIVGAGLAAIVTTVGSALYQRSLERTRDVVRTRIHPRRPTHGGTSTDPPVRDATAALDGPTVVLGAEDGDAPGTGGRPWRRYALLAATGLLVFLVALLAITGIERVKGSPLSGGERGTSVGTMFGGGDATGTPTTTTTAPSTSDSAPTSAAPEETAPPTTTTEAPASTTTTSRAPTLVPTVQLPN